MFQMQPVESSQIAAIGYEQTQQVLRVEFKNGALYEYQNVEPETHASLMAAESVGSLFNQVIKKNPGKYPYQKV